MRNQKKRSGDETHGNAYRASSGLTLVIGRTILPDIKLKEGQIRRLFVRRLAELAEFKSKQQNLIIPLVYGNYVGRRLASSACLSY
jgi:hypothetical protein